MLGVCGNETVDMLEEIKDSVEAVLASRTSGYINLSGVSEETDDSVNNDGSWSHL